jgi:hypothetical protein
MRTYQTLSLIGCIFGILTCFVWGATIGVISNIGGGGTSDVLANAAVGLFFAFIMYIILLVLTFTMKTKTKALGIILIIVGFIAMVITNLWGVLAFALLLPAGIVALRYKAPGGTTRTKAEAAASARSDQKEEGGEEE